MRCVPIRTAEISQHRGAIDRERRPGLGDFEKLFRELVQALEPTLKDDQSFCCESRHMAGEICALR